MRAKIKVLIYKQTRRTTPVSASMRFVFFIVHSFRNYFVKLNLCDSSAVSNNCYLLYKTGVHSNNRYKFIIKEKQ